MNKRDRCLLRCPVFEQATHHFPNQKKHLDRFKAWVEAIDRKLETDEDYEYFRTKRLCHIHFIPMYCYNEKRLSPLAIPTLYLTKQSRDDYWAKDIALRNLALQSNSPDNNADITKDVAETQKNEAVTNIEETVLEVVKEEIIPSNNIQSSLGSDVQESLVNLLIADTLKGENENYTDVQDLPFIELSNLIPVESNVPKPVADVIIEYVPTTEEVSIDTILMNHKYPGDIATSEEVEKLPPEPDLSHDISSDSTLLETCPKEIEKNSDQNCIQRPKRNVRRKSKYHGLSWEVPIRIPMEHNYSKASIVSPASHISSNGVHPKKIIRSLKSKVNEVKKKLKYYKERCKVLLRLNKEKAANQIKCNTITKISPNGPASNIRVIENIFNYLKHKNVGSGVSLPRNV